MATGKQLSFEYGEVSPSLRFRSDAVSYAYGLGKLRNFIIKKTGGACNRQGFEFVRFPISQTSIPSKGGSPGIKGFTFWDASSKTWKTLEYASFSDVSSSYGFMVDNASPVTTITSNIFTNNITGPDPQRVRFTALQDKVFVTPSVETTGLDTVNNLLNVAVKPDGSIDTKFGRKNFTALVTGVGGTGYGLNGVAPFMPVSYLVTAIMADKTERYVMDIATGGYDPTTWNSSTAPATAPKIAYPHAQLTTFINLVINTTGNADADIKSFNIYRAGGANGLSSFFKLAGRVNYVVGSGAASFTDFGADDPTVGPPLDGFGFMKFPEPAGVSNPIKGVNAAAYYQQRLICAMEPNTSNSIKAGDMIASKLGSAEQIIGPLVFANTQSFQFSIPVTDGTPVNAVLEMERCIAFTERGVYVLKGGDQGNLTPTTVNPQRISDEGCSKIIQPKMAGRRGYFINNTHTKLMAIEFTFDGNLTVYEASEYSDHLLLETDLLELEVLGGGENVVYILRKDGKLVRATLNENGAHGFSLIETGGHIEGIFRGKVGRPYRAIMPTSSDEDPAGDVLMAYVIRNGVRCLERLNYRDDDHREGEFFADCYVPFGYRLSKIGAGYGITVGSPSAGSLYVIPVNLKVVTDWVAGSTFTLQADDFLVDTPSVIQFFYKDSDGNTQALRIHITSAGTVVGPHIEYDCYADSDVPTVLQDADANATLTDDERTEIKTFWLPMINQLSGDSLGPVWIAGAENITSPGSVEVAVAADGEVISSPLNPNAGDPLTLVNSASGSPVLTLDLGDYYSFGYVGIPYECEFETLDIEPSDNRTLTANNKLVPAAGVGFHNTRGGFFGMPGKDLPDMQEINVRDEDDPAVQTPNLSDYKLVSFPAEWARPGRVNVKHVDPSPITILSIYPEGTSGK